MSRMKLQVWGALTSSLGSALPCGTLGSHKLPWVTGKWVLRVRGRQDEVSPRALHLTWSPSPAVSHHDPEIPFNHSFIEPPSAGWASDDSFSSDSESGEEDEGPAYCVPPQEGSPQTAPQPPEPACSSPLLYSFSRRVAGAHSVPVMVLGCGMQSRTREMPALPKLIVYETVGGRTVICAFTGDMRVGTCNPACQG